MGSQSQYILNKCMRTWDKLKEVGSNSIGLGNSFWSDDENMYYSNGSSQYVIYVNNGYRDLTADSDPTDSIPDSDIKELLD